MAGKHQGLENKHQRLLELAKTEPLQAAIEARDDLKASKKGRTYMSSIRQLDRIINGDESAWHYGARDQTEAVQFIITNLMLKSAGLGVIPSNVRNESNIARMVGNLITEDVDFAPMTTAQKRLKMIAESYGFQVYTLNEAFDSSGMIFQYRINQKPVDLDEGSRERLSVAPDYDEYEDDEYEDEDNYEDRANGLCDFDEAISILVASEGFKMFADEGDAYEALEDAFWTVFADADGDPEVGWEENGQMHVLSPYKFDTEGF
jgi:hypothetical protein